MTPVTIGDQKFIKDADKGWIDAKTKQPADKGLIRLLDSLVIDEPVLKKLRTKIDTSVEPVFINGQKYVFDVNQGWIDAKTKVRAPESLQLVLSNAVPRFGKGEVVDLTASLGVTGQAAVKKTKAKVQRQPKKPTGGGTLVNNKQSITINKPIVAMIQQLASIDGYLKQQIKNDQLLASKELAQTKEANIENKTDVPDVLNTDEAKDAEKETNAAEIAGATALAALIAYQFDPVKQAVNQVVDFGKTAVTAITDVAKVLNNVFSYFVTPVQSTNNNTSAPWPSFLPAAGATLSANPDVRNAAFAQKSGSQAPIAPSTPDTAPGWFARSSAPQFNISAARPSTTPTSTGTNNWFAPHSSMLYQPSTTSTQTSAAPRISAPPMLAAQPQSTGTQQSQMDTSPGWFARSHGGGFGNFVNPVNPRDVLNFTGNSGDERHFNLLEPETKNAILSAAAEYKQTTGRKLTLNSGRRTNAEQWALWNNRANNPNPVAYPGTSNHEKGWSVDIDQHDATARSILERHGMMWYGAGDPVHYTLQGHGDSGPGGTGEGTMIGTVVDTIADTLSTAKKIFGSVGAALVGASNYEMRPLTAEEPVFTQLARSAAIDRTTAMADSRTPPPPTPPKQVPISPPNINPNKNSPVIQTPATASDMSSVNYYLERFGFAPTESELAR